MIFGLFGGAKKRAAELYEAAQKGDLDGVRQALEKGADINSLDPEFSETALHAAVDKSHVAVVECLLSKGANPDIISNQHFSPLILATAMGDSSLPIVELLISGKASLALAPSSGPNAGGAPIHIAASNGANAILKRLLAAGAPATILPSGNTLMHLAAIGGNAETVEIVSGLGIPVDATENQSRTPLHLAALSGNSAVARKMLELGASVDKKDSSGCTALMHATLQNKANVVDQLLKNGANPDIVVETEDSALNPLYAASINGHDTIVKLLLASGASVTKKVGGLPSVVDMAQQAGHKKIVTMLKDALGQAKAAASAAKTEKQGAILQTKLSDAIKQLDVNALREIAGDKAIKNLPKNWSLLLFSIIGDEKKIKQLIVDGANPNVPITVLKKGIYPLIAAIVLAKDAGLVKALIDGGADVNLPFADGVMELMAEINKKNESDSENNITATKEKPSALMMAAGNGNLKITDLLLDAGANVNAIEPETGVGAFGFALDNKQMRLAKHLLDKGAIPEFGKISTLPLAVAEHGNMELIRAIEARGGVLITEELKGRIGFVAARNKDGEVLDYMLNNGADLNQGNDLAYTPLILATLTIHPELVGRYLEQGANPNGEDIDRETALSLAIEKDHPEIIRLLRQFNAQTQDYPGVSDEAAMLNASRDGMLGTILNLRDAGQSINIVDADGNSPLMLAARAGQVGVVRSLYHLGASLNHKNHAGQTACKLAKMEGQDKVLKTLLEFGAEDAMHEVYGFETREEGEVKPLGTIDMADRIMGRYSHPYKDSLPYDESASEDTDYADSEEDEIVDDSDEEEFSLSPEISEKLDELEALINLPHIFESLPDGHHEGITQRINLIRSEGENAVPRYQLDDLLELHEHFSTQEEAEPLPPLFEAASEGNIQKLRKLIKAGADIHESLGDGTTLLMTATENGHNNIVAELLKLGADPNQSREDTFTALLFACFLGHEDIIKTLVTHGADINHGHVIGSSQGASGNQTGLTVAAARGSLSTCKLLLKLGADINMITDSGYTPLMWSLANGSSEEVAEYLLKSGASPDPDAESTVSISTSTTPLVLAATNGMASVVKMLIRHQVRIDKPDGDGWTALKRAANSGHFEVVSLLLKAGADVNITDNEGCTALWNAAGHGNFEICKLLIKAGAEVNMISNSGRTALAQAIGAHSDNSALSSLRQLRQLLGGDDEDIDAAEEDDESLELVKLLLTKGANPNVMQDGVSLLDEAIENEDADLVKLLKKHGAQPSQEIPEVKSATDEIGDEGEDREFDPQSEELIDAVVGASADKLRELVEAGASLNYVNADGNTALTQALSGLVADSLPRITRRNLRESVDYMLSQHPDLNVPGCDPTPLGLAAYLGDLYLVRVMLRQGAHLETPLLGMGPPLLAAISEARESCAIALINEGANLAAKMPSGITALHGASEKGMSDTVKLLLQKKCDVNLVDQNRFTPLMSASRSGHKEVVQLLLVAGADANLKDAEGKTAADYARENGHDEVANMLG